MTDHLIISAEVVAVADESSDVISQLTSEVRLELSQPIGDVTCL